MGGVDRSQISRCYCSPYLVSRFCSCSCDKADARKIMLFPSLWFCIGIRIWSIIRETYPSIQLKNVFFFCLSHIWKWIWEVPWGICSLSAYSGISVLLPFWLCSESILGQELWEGHLGYFGPGLEVANLTSLHNSLSSIVYQDVIWVKHTLFFFSSSGGKENSKQIALPLPCYLHVKTWSCLWVWDWWL